MQHFGRNFVERLLLRRRHRLWPAPCSIHPCSSASHCSPINKLKRENGDEGSGAKKSGYGYDPGLELVTVLNEPVKAAKWRDSPFFLPNRTKEEYEQLFFEQLDLEDCSFVAVKNLSRRSKLEPMEALIQRWDWQGQMEDNLLLAIDDLEDGTMVAHIFKQLDVKECARQLQLLTNVILCRGQKAVPVSELERVLCRIVFRMHRDRVYGEMGGSEQVQTAKLKLLFDDYIEYFLRPELAQRHTIREWWYKCAARAHIDPHHYPPYARVLNSHVAEFSRLLLGVLVDSCFIPQRIRSKPPAFKKPPKKTATAARPWQHAFAVKDFPIAEQSPHVDFGEQSGFCKMLNVHRHLSNHYIPMHQFQSLHFQSNLLPMKLPPRPWLDRGAGGPNYTYAQRIVRILEDYREMDTNTEMLQRRIQHNAQARPVFDALNVLGATPWRVNTEMLGHLLRALEMSYEPSSADMCKRLGIPRHPSVVKVPRSLSQMARMGLLEGDSELREHVQRAQRDGVWNQMLREGPWLRVRRHRKGVGDAEGEEEEEETKWREQFRHAVVAKVHALRREQYEQNSLWCWLIYRLSLAQHFAADVLYFPHNIDFRGRAYPISPQINHMGDDINRGLLKFARGKPLGEAGLRWLKLHCVNITGRLKRKSLRERLAYAEAQTAQMLAAADAPFEASGDWWWNGSEEPWQTLAACIELRDALRSGPDVGAFRSHLPIHQDGSCNGLQHYAALGRDLEGAREVNLVPEEAPRDIYTSVAERVEQMRVQDEQNEADEKQQAIACELRRQYPGPIERKIIKQTIMTTVYGVTAYGGMRQIGRQLVAVDIEREPAFRRFAPYLTKLVFRGLTSAFANSMALMQWFKACVRQVVHLNRSMEWTTPLGLPVVQPYVTVGRLAGALSFIPVPHKQRNAFPPNFVHSLDSTHMMLTALHCQRRGVTFASVHDCFWTHACDVDAMSAVCRDQFIALHQQPIMQQLSRSFHSVYLTPELREQLLAHNKAELLARMERQFSLELAPGLLDIEQVRDSVYFFS